MRTSYAPYYYIKNIFSWTSNISAALSVSHLDLDHVEFTIQVLKLQNLPNKKVTITMSHLCICYMDHFMVNVEIQLQQSSHKKSKFMHNF